MAILFRILFTLGLLILHVSVLSAQTQVNRHGLETPLKFVSENPSYLLASTFKNTPTYLNCHVSVNVSERLELDLGNVNFYYEKDDEDEEDDDEDENHQPRDDAEIKRWYDWQYKKFDKSQQNNSAPVTSSNSSRSRRNEDEDVDEDDGPDKDETHKLYQQQFDHFKKPRKKREISSPLRFEWFKEEESVIALEAGETKNVLNESYTLYPNGTLKFQASNLTTGEYLCRVTYIKKAPVKSKKGFEIGPIVSQRTVVEIARLINDTNEKKNLTIVEGEAIVVNCPIQSVPEANYSWNFNNNELNFDRGLKQKDTRHFLLLNGSLLIVNSQIADSGKYRCNATNQFAKKLYRSYSSTLNVVSRSDDNSYDGSSLLPKLQSSVQKIKSGQNLILHCASHQNKISWTFTPRSSVRPIVISQFNNELMYVNVSVSQHDGIYNCSTESDFQVFDVTVMTPPVFLEPFKTLTSSVAGQVKFNCSVSGNPMPEVEWFKNGQRVPNNHVKYFEYPIAKIETIDPEDEGLYQCIARNDYGEVMTSSYLHIRPITMMMHPPKNVKCFPMDGERVLVKFDKESEENQIQYFIAKESPRTFDTSIAIGANSTSFELNRTATKAIIPLKRFYLYMRSMVSSQGKMIISQLSKPVVCATQGIEAKFVKPLSGIFLRWDAPETDSNITSYTVQFLNDGKTNQVTFQTEVIGTYEKFDTYVSWSTVEKSLMKIPVKSSNKSGHNGEEWSEIQVAGNVTGLLIINTEEINVRILGSVMEDGELFKQDIKYLSWTNIQSSSISLEPLRIAVVEAREAEIQWDGFENVKCAQICSLLKQDFISRDQNVKLNCEKIHPSAKSFCLKNLKPTSDYDVFMRNCEKTMISTLINFQTKRDVPGPVTQSHITTDTGITLHWKPPHNPNGEIYNYQLEWTFRNETHLRNVSGLSFTFPNTTSTDRFNITVKALGVGGLGYPLIINPNKWGILPRNIPNPSDQRKTTFIFDSFMIFTIIFVSCVLLVVVIGYVLCRRHRYCKNSNGIINSEQSSFPPTTSPLAESMRTDEIYEMQTLIPTTQLVIANGKDTSIKSDIPSNGGINMTENQKILRTSTPTDESIDQMCIKMPPIKCDEPFDILHQNAFLETFNTNPIPTLVETKDLRNGSLKVNGNLSPFKCFQSNAIDQPSTASSSFDSHRQLIESNLCNGLNNNASLNDRSRIGKSSSIETDNEEEDSEENLHDYDLNDSNLSSKPLHPMNSINPMNWEFRRPLVGPNG